jgi:hypothetical protein
MSVSDIALNFMDDAVPNVQEGIIADLFRRKRESGRVNLLSTLLSLAF